MSSLLLCGVASSDVYISYVLFSSYDVVASVRVSVSMSVREIVRVRVSVRLCVGLCALTYFDLQYFNRGFRFTFLFTLILDDLVKTANC